MYAEYRRITTAQEFMVLIARIEANNQHLLRVSNEERDLWLDYVSRRAANTGLIAYNDYLRARGDAHLIQEEPEEQHADIRIVDEILRVREQLRLAQYRLRIQQRPRGSLVESDDSSTSGDSSGEENEEDEEQNLVEHVERGN
ncbi:hypothetical protein CAEBREN_28862 [Caenorhabditis brenneri]|uniref:Uncharacterized protein n=1 Tax=Caenorhabditis brenneri TaxID=135651 RepID=G0P6G9_CAEBE|nr:hypothetical protein CAEBREN_28862 [Caenorhabditis brenneri]